MRQGKFLHTRKKIFLHQKSKTILKLKDIYFSLLDSLIQFLISENSIEERKRTLSYIAVKISQIITVPYICQFSSIKLN